MKKKGITILELIVAIGIGVLLTGGISLALLKNVKVLNGIYSFQKAQFIAENQMEYLRSMRPGAFLEGEMGGLKNGRGEIAVSEYLPGLKKVEVILKWETERGTEKTIRLVTLKR